MQGTVCCRFLVFRKMYIHTKNILTQRLVLMMQHVVL
uniref:Uncharacterized protein n=1 Tax=Anguilla anguilla TaxID=7936 RepID=A0A0E9XF27_ANGAN